ncbi:MAG: hypothetical protein O9306_08380 [Beijerinckiaceae bacterium]|jgi:O-methyltransferase|nr:hypothetical protein [Beijerinckiaceae bacterium]
MSIREKLRSELKQVLTMASPHYRALKAKAFPDDLREQYLSLLESTLVGTIYEDAPLSSMGGGEYDANLREYGWDWPSKAFTMVGTRRLRNFRLMIESVIGGRIPGDIVETGVWRGGACILARAVLKAYNIKDRRVILCDSFSGLPPPNPHYSRSPAPG